MSEWYNQLKLTGLLVVAKRRSCTATGGGPPDAPDLKPEDEIILEIIGKTAVEGIPEGKEIGIPNTVANTEPFKDVSCKSNSLMLNYSRLNKFDGIALLYW